MDATLKVIGVTGGSGTGKSLVARYFARHGFTVIDADLLSREVCAPGTPCVAELAGAFGADMLLPDGSLNRRKLGKLVFAEPERLPLLNEITHKYIKQEIFLRLSSYKDNPVLVNEEGQEEPLLGVVIDAPLLFESNLHKICDAVVAVLADRELRVSRIAERDNIPVEEAKARISSQKEDGYYTERADFILYNNGDTEELYLQADIVLSLLS